MSLNIATKDWKIVNLDDYLFIRVSRLPNPRDDEDEYFIAGIINEEEDFVNLYSSNSKEKIATAFGKILYGIDSTKPLVDLREQDENSTDSITILKNMYGQDGSDLN